MSRPALLQTQAHAVLSAHFPNSVFTAGDVRTLGISPTAFRGLLAAGGCVRVSHGAYALADRGSDDALWTRVRARLAGRGNSVAVAHVTAAHLHNLRMPFVEQLADDRVWLLHAPELAAGMHRDGIALLPAQYEPEHITEIDGLRVTTLARTAMDLGRGCRLERALVPIDHALARGVPRGALVELAVYMKGWPGSRVFKGALEIASPLAESGLESMSRAVVYQEGLDAPELQAELRGASGKRYRVDMVWRRRRVILEIDGEGKYKSPQDIFNEKRREDDLRRADWDVIRWTYEDVFTGDRPGLSWVKRALRK